MKVINFKNCYCLKELLVKILIYFKIELKLKFSHNQVISSSISSNEFNLDYLMILIVLLLRKKIKLGLDTWKILPDVKRLKGQKSMRNIFLKVINNIKLTKS